MQTYSLFFTIIILTCFGLTALYGFYHDLRILKQLRAPRNYANTLLDWVEQPFSSFRQARDAWLGVNIHRLAIFLPGAVGLYLLATRPLLGTGTSGSGSNLAGLLSVMILSGCAAGMGLFWGQAAFGPLTELMAGRSHSAISDEGLLKGGRLFPWATFCQFSLNDERTAIKLWSAHFKGAVAFTLMPPPDRIPAVESILLRHLPPAGLSSPGALEHFRFSTFMVALLIGSAAISFLILDSLAVTPAIALLFGLIYLLALLGSRIILLGIYGGLARPATIA